jgi:hypothetical protein
MHCGKNEFFVSKQEGILSKEWNLQIQVFLHSFSKTALKSVPLSVVIEGYSYGERPYEADVHVT